VFVLDDLLLAPIKGLMFIAGRIKEAADQQLSDPQVIKRDLLQLEMQQELGQISKAEADERKTELFARLRAARGGPAGGTRSVHTAGSSAFEVEAVGADNYGSRFRKLQGGR